MGRGLRILATMSMVLEDEKFDFGTRKSVVTMEARRIYENNGGLKGRKSDSSASQIT